MRWHVTLEFGEEYLLRVSVDDDWQYMISPRLIMEEGDE